MICFRWHAPMKSELRHDLGSFVICGLAHSSPAVIALLLRWGFLDALIEGGVMFWRWDFWNANHAAWIRYLRSVSSGPA